MAKKKEPSISTQFMARECPACGENAMEVTYWTAGTVTTDCRVCGTRYNYGMARTPDGSTIRITTKPDKAK